MNAVSPFSLFDSLSPGKVLGQIAGTIAENAKGQNGLSGAFSAAWKGLDANADGALNAKDALGHAVGVRNAVLQGLADTFGYDTSADARALRNEAGALADAATTGMTGIKDMAGSGVPVAQMLIASAPPALPSAPAARAVENLPGIAEIRATYAAMRRPH